MPIKNDKEINDKYIMKTKKDMGNTPEEKDSNKKAKGAGEDARFVDHLPLKLVIIDEQIVMFGMEDPVADSDALTIVVVEHPSLAQILKVAFTTVWENGLTFDQAYDRYGTRRTQTA